MLFLFLVDVVRFLMGSIRWAVFDLEIGCNYLSLTWRLVTVNRSSTF